MQLRGPNACLCYWRVFTMKLLITQALIKDLGGAPCGCQSWRDAVVLHHPRTPWEHMKTPLLQCLPPAACTAVELLPYFSYSARAQPLLHPQVEAKIQRYGLKIYSASGRLCCLPGTYLGSFTLKMSLGSRFLFQCNCREFMKLKDLKAEQRAFPCIQRSTCIEIQCSPYSTTHSQPTSSFFDLNAAEIYRIRRANTAQTGQQEIPSAQLQQHGPGGTAPSGEGQSFLHVLESLIFTSSYFNIISCQEGHNCQQALVSAPLISSYGLT